MPWSKKAVEASLIARKKKYGSAFTREALVASVKAGRKEAGKAGQLAIRQKYGNRIPWLEGSVEVKRRKYGEEGLKQLYKEAGKASQLAIRRKYGNNWPWKIGNGGKWSDSARESSLIERQRKATERMNKEMSKE